MSFLLGHIRYLGGFGLASILATVADLILFSTLVRNTGIPLPFDAALGAILGAIIHFTLCRQWVFAGHKRQLLQSASRYILISGVVMVIHSSLTTFLAVFIDPEVGWLISKISCFLLVTYPASRYLVFGRVSRSAPRSTLRLSHPSPRMAVPLDETR
ncbi:MAG: GtrA family protein [Bradymonadales bacterium]|nr:GtrA family protein [Bradymonadales bacterium]